MDKFKPSEALLEKRSLDKARIAGSNPAGRTNGKT